MRPCRRCLRSRVSVDHLSKRGRRSRQRAPASDHKSCRSKTVTDDTDTTAVARREAATARMRRWRERNPERSRENTRRSVALWREKHPEREKEIKRRYYERHREDVKEKSRAARAADPEKDRQRSKDWARRNPEQALAISRNKKARKRKAEGSHTAKDISRIRELQSDRCAVCKTELSAGGHVDHIQPLSKGGSNLPKNLQLLCAPCNMQKHTTDPIDFMRSRGFLI